MKTKKLIAFVATALTAVALAFCLAACGGAPKMTAQYTSNTTVGFSNFKPANNFFVTSQQMQQIETYDDGTYCFTVVTTTISNLHVGPDVSNDDWKTQAEKGNDQGQTITKYYGTVTVVVDPEDASAITLKLASPTRVTYKSHGAVYVDSETATDEQKIPGFMGQGEPTPAPEYLKALIDKFGGEKEVDINGKNGSFKQIALG